jgi:hypothetical protein
MSEHGSGGEIQFEPRDVRASAILKFTVYLFLVTILVLFLMRLLYVGFARFEARQQPPAPIMRTDQNRRPPMPRLQEQPTLDVTTLKAREAELLKSYGWVDQTTGIARVPIDEAMRLALQKGYPSRATAEAAK